MPWFLFAETLFVFLAPFGETPLAKRKTHCSAHKNRVARWPGSGGGWEAQRRERGRGRRERAGRCRGRRPRRARRLRFGRTGDDTSASSFGIFRTTVVRKMQKNCRARGDGRTGWGAPLGRQGGGGLRVRLSTCIETPAGPGGVGGICLGKGRANRSVLDSHRQNFWFLGKGNGDKIQDFYFHLSMNGLIRLLWSSREAPRWPRCPFASVSPPGRG